MEGFTELMEYLTIRKHRDVLRNTGKYGDTQLYHYRVVYFILYATLCFVLYAGKITKLPQGVHKALQYLKQYHLIRHTPETGMLQSGIGRGFHPGTNAVALAISRIAQKRTTPYHSLGNARFHGVVTG